jgi:hypothetical protein
VPELTLIGRDGSQEPSEWRQLERAVREHRDGFLNDLLAKRPDLAGLPVRKGKDCQLERTAAQALTASSLLVRRHLLAAMAPAGGARRAAEEPDDRAASVTFTVYHELARNPGLTAPETLPVLEQILTGEAPVVRLGLAQHLRSPAEAPAVAAVLARRAVFDASEEVRQMAVAGLQMLPPRDYLPALIGGLRYPWTPANNHAAEAIVALRANAAIPELVRLLDAPDPCAPFDVEDGGRRVPAVRELVRVNHHAGCLLCHAPSFSADDPVRGPVPNPLLPLPRPGQYYGSSPGGLFVRADFTYLRQDFSEVLKVEHPGRWPNRQRFDFFVRVRRLDEGEARAWAGRERSTDPPPMPASRRAALDALRHLTGLDGGITAGSWGQALAARARTAGPN